MIKKKILIIEDDRNIQTGLSKTLLQEGFEVDQAFDGEEGVFQVQRGVHDLIVLDLMMPFRNGFEVISEVRSDNNETPIIVLSAKNKVQDKIKSFQLGADDFLEKPFHVDELIARINRKFKKNCEEKIFKFGDFIFDVEMQQLSKNSSDIHLNKKERRLLLLFLTRKNRILEREKIISYVWEDDYEGTDRAVDNLVLGLRKKIGSNMVVTIHGVGYRFVTS